MRISIISWAFLLSVHGSLASAEKAITISMDWDRLIGISKTHISILACAEPPMRRGYPIHDKLFNALHELNADYPRLQLWAPYPRIAVAELYPPNHERTFWNFELMDPLVADFIKAADNHPIILNIGTIPAWMLEPHKSITFPEDPNEIDWSYGYVGNFRFSDATVKLIAEYQGRLASWYIKGGFTDENGIWHSSGHHYNIDYWEVLNEPDIEHEISPADYTRLYDAIVEEIKKISPSIKFMGPALSNITENPEYFTYFLDKNNHKPGIPIDMVSYHFYSTPVSDESAEVMQHTIFEQADHFLTVVRYIDAIRRKLSPTTGTAVDELGSMLTPAIPTHPVPIAKSYWNLTAAMWAYVYGNLALIGVDMVHASELIDYPGQVTSTTLTDWTTGEPNARYWALKLLRDNFNPGDRLVEVEKIIEAFEPNPAATIYRQGFISKSGQRKLLIVNKRNKPTDINVVGSAGGYQQKVDELTVGFPEKQKIIRDTLHLPGLAVMVISYPKT
jgi:hypothetical protein